MKTILKLHALVLLLCVMSLNACAANETSETRAISPFTELTISHALKIMLTQSDNYSLKLEGDAEMIKDIEINQSGNSLSIGMKEHSNRSYNSEVTIYISCKQLSKLQLSGASSLETKGSFNLTNLAIISNGAGKISMDLTASSIDVSVNGASHVTLTGKAGKADFSINGASALKAGDFDADNMKVECSGASSAVVNAQKTLDIVAAGASNVKYSGSASVTKETTGVSSIKNMN